MNFGVTKEEILKLAEEKKKQKSALAALAAQQTQGQPMVPPKESGLLGMLRGSPDQATRQAQMATYEAILNREPGSTGIGAAATGMRKGAALMDDIRGRQREEQLQGAQAGVNAASSAYDDAVAQEQVDYTRNRQAEQDTRQGRIDKRAEMVQDHTMARQRAADERQKRLDAGPGSGQSIAVEYLDPETGGVAREGFAIFDPKTQMYMDEYRRPLTAGTFRKMTTGRTAQDVASRTPAKSNEADALVSSKIGSNLLQNANSMIFRPDGSVDRSVLFTAGNYSGLIPFYNGAGIPFTKGQDLATNLDNVVDTTLRIRSGKTIPLPERKQLQALVRPSWADSDATIRTKMNIMQAMMDGKLDAMLENPAEMIATIEQQIRQSEEQSGTSGTSAGSGSVQTGKTSGGVSYTVEQTQ